MYFEKQNRKMYNGNLKDKNKYWLQISKKYNSTTTGAECL